MTKKITFAVDAMGGEDSPKKIIDGIKLFNKKNKDVYFKIFGNKTIIDKNLNNFIDKNSFEIINTDNQVVDTDSALGGAKKGKDTSMWLAIESVKNKESDIVISAGNTGALFVISKLNLKMIENIDKPALSGLWPNKNGMNVVLDLGANIDCSEKNLIDFALMGSSLFKSLYANETPKVALLNIGSEEIKGNDKIKNTYKKLSEIKNNNFQFKGYIEGNKIMDGDVNVIVTDGFTGNIALKTAEGTANFLIKELKNTLSNNFIAKISSAINFYNLKKFKNKLDPRLYNGAIFIGLDSPVVLNVCKKIIKGDLINKIKENII